MAGRKPTLPACEPVPAALGRLWTDDTVYHCCRPLVTRPLKGMVKLKGASGETQMSREP